MLYNFANNYNAQILINTEIYLSIFCLIFIHLNLFIYSDNSIGDEGAAAIGKALG